MSRRPGADSSGWCGSAGGFTTPCPTTATPRRAAPASSSVLPAPRYCWSARCWGSSPTCCEAGSAHPVGEPVADQPARDRIAPRHPETVVVDMAHQPIALEPAGVRQLGVIDRDLARCRLGVEAEHDVGRERPGLRGMVVHRADLDRGLLAHLARDRVFEALARLDKTGEGRIHAGHEVLVAA